VDDAQDVITIHTFGTVIDPLSDDDAAVVEQYDTIKVCLPTPSVLAQDLAELTLSRWCSGRSWQSEIINGDMGPDVSAYQLISDRVLQELVEIVAGRFEELLEK
jgi:hypothetical protein